MDEKMFHFYGKGLALFSIQPAATSYVKNNIISACTEPSRRRGVPAAAEDMDMTEGTGSSDGALELVWNDRI